MNEADEWTVLLAGDHLGFIVEVPAGLGWGDSTPEKAKRFRLFSDATDAALIMQSRHPDINQVRVINSSFGSQRL